MDEVIVIPNYVVLALESMNVSLYNIVGYLNKYKANLYKHGKEEVYAEDIKSFLNIIKKISKYDLKDMINLQNVFVDKIFNKSFYNINTLIKFILEEDDRIINNSTDLNSTLDIINTFSSNENNNLPVIEDVNEICGMEYIDGYLFIMPKMGIGNYIYTNKYDEKNNFNEWLITQIIEYMTSKVKDKTLYETKMFYLYSRARINKNLLKEK